MTAPGHNPIERTPTAAFISHHGDCPLWRGTFYEPLETRAALQVDQVLPLLEFAQQASQRRWVVLMLSYEAAAAFDPAFAVHPPLRDLPLAWAAVYDAPGESPLTVPEDTSAGHPRAWAPGVTRCEYDDAIQRIQRYICEGDTYQVNMTFPLHGPVPGDCFAWFGRLCRAQQADYCAYLDMGSWTILSISPELFFRRTGDGIVTRPMKGTSARGRWLQEDQERRCALSRSPKNRAENVMIVDLLRNDLGRICRPGSVRTTRLFEVESLGSVLQMTSTVAGRLRADTGLQEIMQALFPCGSITGAPKIRTMEIIRDLEPFPRGVYTGTVGLVAPGGDCAFNVAIRTVVVNERDRRAVCSVGGGITHDSTSDDEYEECLLKARFLTRIRPAFDLLESLLLEDGEYFLLQRHLDRLSASGTYFDRPVNLEGVTLPLKELALEHPDGSWKVRLLVDRDGAVRSEAQPLDRVDAAPVWTVGLARCPVNSSDTLLYHKTTAREVYDRALAEHPECRDVILWNERGEITESCYANVVVVQGGAKWTPPRHCGLLAGTLREELLAKREITERLVTREELAGAEKVLLVNSVRKWICADLHL